MTLRLLLRLSGFRSTGETTVDMYRSSGGGGGGDVNVPPLPTRRSSMNGQRSAGTPQLPLRRHQQTLNPPPSHHRPRTTSEGPELPASSSSLSSSLWRLNLANLDRRVRDSSSRAFNDYRDLPTTATTAVLLPGDAQLVSRDQTPQAVSYTHLTLPTILRV